MTTEPHSPRHATTPTDPTATSVSADTPAGTDRPAPRTVQHTRAASTYVFLVAGALVTVALVVFIVQNLNASPPVRFFGWSYQLPVGINMLIAALAGALVMAFASAVRILQLRKAYKKG